MNASRPQARELFVAALKLAPEGWDDYLREQCGDDTALRDRARELLQAHAEAGSFLDRPVAALAPELTQGEEPPAVAEGPGTVIGPYKLLEQIGEGGMGLVFVAEQAEPVRRRVALKVIKPGLDTREVVARFEAERQALVLMDHPNIAKVLDAGATDSGRPYFAMELVRGLPITDYCDQARLTTRQRLDLFVTVCRAVQHAHQKGIIHRDLKPSNVLVTLHDGTPVVKVIDFGVAKAVGQRLTEKTVYTRFTQVLGTPLYMSPEQAELSGLDIDTRSDVYALGVLLYELLTGATPFDSERLRAAGFDEMRRIIREEEPPRPSQRLSTLDAAARSTVSHRRGVDDRRLGQTLRGEPDWIVMRALEKDRTRRYESASAFAADVERYLNNEPVEACSPSLPYRATKFVKRHQGPVLAASVVVLALVLGVAGTSLGMVQAWQMEQEANEQRDVAWQKEQEANEQRDVAQQQRDDAQRRRDEVRAVSERLQSTLYAAHMNLAKHTWDAGGPERVLDRWSSTAPSRGRPTCAASNGIISTGCAARVYSLSKGTPTKSPA
jgi:serine/threonine protein kinase